MNTKLFALLAIFSYIQSIFVINKLFDEITDQGSKSGKKNKYKNVFYGKFWMKRIYTPYQEREGFV